MFIVSRIAKRNPEISGCTLYFTNLGLWSLNRENALEFEDRSKAEIYAADDAKIEIVCEGASND